MKIATRKPLIALLLASSAALSLPAMAQSAAQAGAADAQAQAAQAQQAAAQAGQAGQAADHATHAAGQAAAQANGGGQTWASLDTNGNGTISKNEAQVNAGLLQVFDEADSNKDGELTQDEYKAYVQAQQGAAGQGG